MKISVAFILGLVLLPQIDDAASQEHLEAGRSNNHVLQVEGLGGAVHARTDFESRKARNTGQRANGARRKLNRSVLKRREFNVTVLPNGKNVTYITVHSNTYQYMGNWSLHAQCLMPCNIEHTNPCTQLGDGNCTCVARNDEWGRKVGVCALKNVTLGSDEYGRTTAWMPKP
uniref:Putative secreted protein n=1 Tax=Amblyomma americanum TaxID=6943 RepID=A0A0C9S4S2_AMBAM